MKKTLLCGSAILRKIFETYSDRDVEKGFLLINPFTFFGTKVEELTKRDLENQRVFHEIRKDFEDYLVKADVETIAVDFYVAAGLDCYEFNGNYYTANQAFKESDYYKSHKEEISILDQIKEKQVWMPLMEKYANTLLSRFDKDSIVLFRYNFGNKGTLNDYLRFRNPRTAINCQLKEMEEAFIKLINPKVIDLSRYYFIDNSIKNIVFEPLFYKDCRNAFLELTNTEKRIINKANSSFVISRIIRYYDSMMDRGFTKWFVDPKSVVAKIVTSTSKDFVARYQEFLAIILEKNMENFETIIAELSGSLLEANDYSGFVKTIRAIQSVITGDLNRGYEHYKILFDEKARIVNSIAKQLTENLKHPINNEMAADILLFSGNKEQIANYINKYAMKMHVVDVWGSCVSREILNERPESIYVNNYIFKQNAILSKDTPVPYDLPASVNAYGSDYLKRTIKGEFSRDGLDILKKKPGDWIVIDLYNLVARMVKFRDKLFEADKFIRDTPLFSSIKSECINTYLFDEIKHEQIKPYIYEFAESIKQLYGTNIVLIRIKLNSEYISLDNKLKQITDGCDRLDEKSSYIRMAEDMFIEYTDCFVIDLSKYFYSDQSFRFGGQHIVHYEHKFYQESCKYIMEILLGKQQKIYDIIDEKYLYLRDLKLQ